MPLAVKRRHHAVLALVGVVLLGTYAYFRPAPGPNQNTRYDTTRAIVEEGTLRIDDYHENTIDKARSGEHWYSDKAPMAAIVAAPAYAAGYAVARATHPADVVRADRALQERLYHLAAFAGAALPGALLGVLVALHLLRTLGAAARLGVVAATTVALGLGTPLFAYGTMLYGHELSALFAFASYALLFGPTPPTRRAILLAGLAGGAATLSEYIAAPTIAVIAIARFWPTGRPTRRSLADAARSFAWLCAGGLPCALAFLAHNAVATGSPWRLAYAAAMPGFQEYVSAGFFGFRRPDARALLEILVGSQRGLFVLSPVLLAALGGARAFFRQDRRAAIAAYAAASCLALMNAGYSSWWGGAATYPRYLTTAVAFLAPGLYFALASRSAWTRRMTELGALVSVANAVAIVAVHPQAQRRYVFPLGFAWESLVKGDLGVAFWRAPTMNGVDPYVPPGANLGMALTGSTGLASVVPLLLFWAAAFAMIHAVLRRAPAAAPPR